MLILSLIFWCFACGWVWGCLVLLDFCVVKHYVVDLICLLLFVVRLLLLGCYWGFRGLVLGLVVRLASFIWFVFVAWLCLVDCLWYLRLIYLLLLLGRAVSLALDYVFLCL